MVLTPGHSGKQTNHTLKIHQSIDQQLHVNATYVVTYRIKFNLILILD
jgi:hypothetical protein